MTHPIGQEFVAVDGPSVFNCDICTSPTSIKHIATSVGGAGQSTICWDCAQAISGIVRPRRKAEALV